MKTLAQIGQDFKRQYPGAYDQYPDEVVGQRALVKDPSLGDSSMGDISGQAVKEALFQPGSNTRELATNPITQAKALPGLLGSAGAVTGIPMGASLGTGVGNLIADAALKSYGRSDQIPSTRSQVLGTGTAAIGDLTAIPAINRKIFGSQVGAAERTAGVPSATQIPSTPMTLGQKTLGEFINDAIDSVGSDTPKDYTFWAQLKDQVDRIYKLGKNEALTTLDQGRLKALNAAAQSGINYLVPGRAAPATALAMSQTVPNAISKGVGEIPWWGKAIIGEGGLQAALRKVGSVNK